MSTDAQVKQCSRCRKVKPVGEFYRNRQNRDGLRNDCKRCHNRHDTDYQRSLRAERLRDRRAIGVAS